MQFRPISEDQSKSNPQKIKRELIERTVFETTGDRRPYKVEAADA
jgi:hypothetical protein